MGISIDCYPGTSRCHSRLRINSCRWPGAYRVSRSLAQYLDQNERRFNDWVVAEIEQLKQNIYDQWIVFHDLNPTNILLKRLSFDEYRLVVIDGIGHDHFIPLASYSTAFASKKLVRVWNRRYRQWYASFPGIVSELKPYSAI